MCMPQPIPPPTGIPELRSASVSPSPVAGDSSVTLQLALDVARELGRSPVDVLFIDLEGQYQATIDHVSEMLGRPDVRPWWVCLPLNLAQRLQPGGTLLVLLGARRRGRLVRPLPKQRG